MVKWPGVIGWKANARSPGWTVWENAPLLPRGGGGGWAQLELTDALSSLFINYFSNSYKPLSFHRDKINFAALPCFRKSHLCKLGIDSVLVAYESYVTL